MQSLHRYRSRLVHDATQLINQTRAFLLERGRDTGWDAWGTITANSVGET